MALFIHAHARARGEQGDREKALTMCMLYTYIACASSIAWQKWQRQKGGLAPAGNGYWVFTL